MMALLFLWWLLLLRLLLLPSQDPHSLIGRHTGGGRRRVIHGWQPQSSGCRAIVLLLVLLMTVKALLWLMLWSLVRLDLQWLPQRRSLMQGRIN